MPRLDIDHAVLRSAIDRVLPLIPQRPAQAINGQVRLYVSRDPRFLHVEAVDSYLHRAGAYCPLQGIETPFDDVFPAHRLVEMLKQTEGKVRLDARERAATTLRDATVSFTFPLHATPQDFTTWDPSAPQTTHAVLGVPELANALARVSHALGSPTAANPALRLVQIAAGKAVAYSGRRLQEAHVAPVPGSEAPTAGGPMEVLVPDTALVPLARGLRSIASGTAFLGTSPQPDGIEYFFVSAGAFFFAWPRPRIGFTELDAVRRMIAAHRSRAGRLVVSRGALMQAARAARVLADEKEPLVTLDLTQINGAPIAAVAGTSQDNLVRTELAHAEWHDPSGNERRSMDSVTYSLDDLSAVVEYCPDEVMHLHIAHPSAASLSGPTSRPLTVIEDSQGALAVIPQV